MLEWFNQCPVALGMNDSSRYRRSAVDLVYWDEKQTNARLIELKWPSKRTSKDPLDALRKILQYGAAYLFCRVHENTLHFPATSLIKMNVSHVSIEVVAPCLFCENLIKQITKPHGAFIDNKFVDSKISGLSMSLKVLAFLNGFPDDFEQMFKNGDDVRQKCFTYRLTPEGQVVRDAFNNLTQLWP